MHSKIFLLGLFFFLLIGETYSQTLSRPEKWAKPVSAELLMNFYRLNQDVFRSRQPNRAAFEALEKMGIQSVLNLRTSFADKKLIKGLSFHYYQVPMSPDRITTEQLVEALKVLKDAPKPILVHCVHGADRTGAVIAMYRIIFEGWTKQEALDEMIKGGYRFHDVYLNIPRLIREVEIDSIRKELCI